MKRTMISGIIRLALLISGLITMGTASALTDMQGNKKHFNELLGNGKWTVLEIWSSECPACPDAVFYMNNLKARYDKAELIGISVDGDYGADGPDMAKRFIKQHKITFPSLFSSTEEIDGFLAPLGEELFGTPSVLIFDPRGKLRGIEVGAIISQDVIDFIEREEQTEKE